MEAGFENCTVVVSVRMSSQRPRLNHQLIDLLEPVTRWLGEEYFDADVRGVDRWPEGPALVVGNHNAGIVTPDSFILYGELVRQHGVDALPVALAHELLFRVPLLRDVLTAGRAVPAGPESAAKALEKGHKVLVYPGGDWETHRPSRHRDRIDFGGRRGFVRLALEAKVPVIPVVTAGAHDGWYVLTRGDWIARSLGLDRLFRIKVFPIAFGLPTGLIIGPATLHLPLPTEMIIDVGEPIELQGDPESAEDVQRGYDLVTWTMQERLTELAAELR